MYKIFPNYSVPPLLSKLGLILFTLNIFRPYPAALDGWARVFWFDALLIVFFIYFYFSYAILSKYSFRKNSLLVAFFLLTLFTITSLNSGSFSNLTHYARFVYFIFFIFFFVAPWASLDPFFYKRLSILLLWSSVPMAIIFALQMFPTYGISNLLYWLYSDEKLRPFYSNGPRVYGTFFNANWAGVYLMACWVSLFSLFLRRDISKILTICIGVFLFSMTVATGSRTALFGSIVAILWLVVFWFIFSNSRKHFLKLILLGLTFLIGFGVLYWVSNDMFFWKRYNELFQGDFAAIRSLATRIDAWHEGINYFIQSPVLGPGVKNMPHNSYITLLQAFGLVGFAPFLFFLCLLLWRWLYLGSTFDVMFSSSVLVGFMVMSTTAEFFFTTQVMLLILPIITGIFFVSKHLTMDYSRLDHSLPRTYEMDHG